MTADAPTSAEDDLTLSATHRDTIRQITARDIDDSLEGSIQTFNDLPDWMIEEVRAIGREHPLTAYQYLEFYVAIQHQDDRAELQHHADAAHFFKDVVQGRKEARSWRFADSILVPFEHLPTTPLEIHYAEVLAEFVGERWFRLRPAMTDHQSDPLPGQVGIVRRRTRYWEKAPPALIQFQYENPECVEPVDLDGLAGSIRRWIARRLAWWARVYLDENRGNATPDGIIGAIEGSNTTCVTSDARIAAGALAREASTYGSLPSFPQQAGFLGPDDWYRS